MCEDVLRDLLREGVIHLVQGTIAIPNNAPFWALYPLSQHCGDLHFFIFVGLLDFYGMAIGSPLAAASLASGGLSRKSSVAKP
jgi:hypothetical protein